MNWLALIAQLAGSEAGNAASRLNRDTAMKLIQSAMDEFGKINVPKLKELFLQSAPDTQLKNIHDDPTYRSQQNAADAQLNDVIASGGLTLADKAALNAIRNKVAGDDSARRKSIENDMAARGTLNSGTALAMQLANTQHSANSEAQAAENAAGEAQRRAFEAIRLRAQNAGQGLDRDYRQQSEAARAQDAINRGNTDIANAALKYNAGLPQQDFQNQMSLAQAKVDPAYRLAGAHSANAQNTRDQWNESGKLVGSAISSTSTPTSNNSSTSTPRGDGYSNDSGGQDWGNDSNALTSESTSGDGSENYEVDPITGRIRRKTTGLNF